MTTMTLDYQAIVDIIAELLVVAMPIGVLFGLVGKMVTFFLSMLFGQKAKL